MTRQCLLISFLAGFLLCQGCVSQNAAIDGDRVHVEMLRNGMMQVGKETMPLDRLPAKLKSMGVKSQMAIIIAMPKTATNADRTDIGRTLAKAKYYRYIFTGPRKVKAGVVNPSKTTTRKSY